MSNRGNRDPKDLAAGAMGQGGGYWEGDPGFPEGSELLGCWGRPDAVGSAFCLIPTTVVQLLSHVHLFVSPWTAACQAAPFSTISWISSPPSCI